MSNVQQGMSNDEGRARMNIQCPTWLKIIVRSKLIKTPEQLAPLLDETDELISILFKSIETAKKRKDRP